MPTEKPRLTITVSNEELRQIEDYWHSHKLRNQTQAILSLVRLGLAEVNQQKLESGKVVVTDARLQLMSERFEQLDNTDKTVIYKIAGVLLEQDKYKSLMPVETGMRGRGRLVARDGVTVKQEHPADIDAFLKAIDESGPPETV